MENQIPVVSAVIPTRNRPELVCRAVRSVLAQTVSNLECIVVIDGPDAATVQALGEIQDSRLRVIALEENVGGCEARNLGGRAARGEWVGLLDDDDEWLPQRLEMQFAAAARSPEPATMVVSRFLDRGAKDDDLLRPHLFPRPGQHISEFLWCEVSPLGGIAGFPQTSTWLLRRDFFLAVPFTKGLKVLQDLDWLLHGYHHPAMRVVFVEEPLTIFHNDHARQRVTKRIDWQFSRDWALSNRGLFTPKALGFFLVIYCVNPAAQQGASWKEIQSLIKQIRAYGRITPKLILLGMLYLFLYPGIAKVLSPRKRASMLYHARNLVRRTG
ncbi:MAG TPA: glycosyltransferase family 2 protein [Acidobacteriaceae bacterium]|nr:glycosyltransferase family 2 protein [Acidobacteriaceae bacterium]